MDECLTGVIGRKRKIDKGRERGRQEQTETKALFGKDNHIGRWPASWEAGLFLPLASQMEAHPPERKNIVSGSLRSTVTSGLWTLEV